MSSPLLARIAGNWARAGDLYYQQGKIVLAAQMYEKAGMKAEAARLFSESGNIAEAVRLLVEVGDRREAARLLERSGQLRDAIAQYESAGALWEAAELASKARLSGVAARLYERAGGLDKAAALFEANAEPAEALRVLEREGKRLAAALRTGSTDPRTRAELKRVELQRGEILARLKRVDEAVELFERNGAHGRVGELLEQAGSFDLAALAHLGAGQPDKALRLLPKTELAAGDRARVYRANHLDREAAECFVEAGMDAEAAECYELAGLASKSAPLWEKTGDMKRAADLYFRERLFDQAMRCFTAAGDMESAVSAALAADDRGSAAELLLASERFFEAGEHALAAGRTELALEALQRLAADHPDFERATMLLVPLLIEDGLHSAALARLEMLGGGIEKSGPIQVDRAYWEGRALEAAGRFEEAARAYEHAVALNRGFRDVTARLRGLGELSESSGPRPVTGASTVRLQSLSGLKALEPGAILAGRYEINREIGHGGMARVYQAFDRELREAVAIKTLLAGREGGGADEERLLREVQISRRITHPNVVRVYDIGRFPGGIFVTMELLHGRSLDSLIKERGALPLAEVRSWALAVARGLEAAHRLKVVHRDLKPANIVIDEGGAPKILDFGIARRDDGDLALTGTGEVMGSPMYMAPEQLCGEPIDGRTDLYALGVLIFTAVTGREPFQGKTASAIALKHLQETPPSPTELRVGLPSEWSDLISALLAKKPSDRPADAAAVTVLLEALPISPE